MNAKSTAIVAALCGLAMLVALAGPGRAAQDEAADTAPAPPEIAEPGDESRQAGEQAAPPPVSVDRRQQFGQTITEYKRGGRLFLMTVKPRNGPTQYWDDLDGDGQFQRSNSNNIDETMNLPKWRLGNW